MQSRVLQWLLRLLMVALAASLAGCETNTLGYVEDSTTDRVAEGRNGRIADLFGPCGPRHEGAGSYYFEQTMQWTPDGAHLVFDHLGTILVVDREGTRLRTLVDVAPRYPMWKREPSVYFPHGIYFDVSPDGARVVYTSCEFRREAPHVDPERGQDYYDYEIVVINLDGTGKRRLTRNAEFEHYPVWSPDGKRIAAIGEEIITISADGTEVRQGVALTTYVMRRESTTDVAVDAEMSDVRQGEAIPTPSLREKAYYVTLVQAPPQWSADGEYLAIMAAYEGVRLYTIRTDGSDWRRVAGTVVGEAPHLAQSFRSLRGPVLPMWSPDGELLAFVMADEEGEPAGVYTVRPDGSDRFQVLEGQGTGWHVSQVLWSPDGSELLIGSDSHFFLVARDGSNARRVELATPLAKAWRVGAWSPDGERIAIYVPGEFHLRLPPQIYTITREGTDLRALVKRGEDGFLAPANSSQ